MGLPWPSRLSRSVFGPLVTPYILEQSLVVSKSYSYTSNTVIQIFLLSPSYSTSPPPGDRTSWADYPPGQEQLCILCFFEKVRSFERRRSPLPRRPRRASSLPTPTNLMLCSSHPSGARMIRLTYCLAQLYAAMTSRHPVTLAIQSCCTMKRAQSSERASTFRDPKCYAC